MQPSQPSAPARGRAPGSFSPLPSSATGSPVKNHQHHHNQQQQQSASSSSSSRRPAPPPLHIESPSPIDEAPNSAVATPTFSVTKTRQQRAGSPATPIYNQFTTHSNASASSLQHHNFSRPTGSPRAVTHGSSSPLVKNESRKHTATQGMFEPTLPSTATSNLSQVGAHSGNSSTAGHNAALTASQIAAQAAVMSHKNHLHTRQRSQTVPFPGESNEGPRRGSGSRGPPNGPPQLGTAETMPSAYGHSNHLQADRSGNANSFAATTAANVVFPRSGHNSPREPSTSPLPPPPTIPVAVMEKPPMSKSEKAKAKLFSRPVKIGASKEAKDKGLPSPGKIGSALSVLQRGNFSTSSLVDPSNQSLYSLSNSSSATIRPTESAEDKGKEKRHFLSRQKQKLKDDYHLGLSSAASNSRPTDPSAPSSLYNFNLSSLTGTTGGFSKSKKDKKYGGERSDSRLDNSSTFNLVDFPALSQQSTTSDFGDNSVGLGLTTPTSLDEAWPYLKKLLLIVFEGEDLRMPIEDINRMVQMHIQSCIYKRAPNAILDDIREFLVAGFASLDRTLRSTSEDRFLPTLVELWLFTFTSILPYLQSVFLPLDLEVAGRGTLLMPDQARDFWGGAVTSPSGNNAPAHIAPVGESLDVRQLVLNAYRDIVILPRYDTLKTIFSRLSLEFLPSSFGNTTLTSPPHEALMSTSPPEYFPPMAPRPGTAMSLDPSVASYNSSSGTYFDGSAGGRSRAVSNVSYNSHGSDGHRPFTPSALSSVREQNVESSKQVTDMAGRMLQCMSVLAGLGSAGSPDDDANNKKMAELCKMLKLNWLGRGRTGRNRRGIVGGRVKRDETREEVRVA